jgi:hypothetical protein
MPRYHIEIDVECETMEQAEQVAAERLGPDEDYGFEYKWASEPLVTANPRGQRPNDGDGTPDYLQVFMAHESQIRVFKAWMESMGWELQQMPRFDMPAHHYTITHIMNPKNLDEILRKLRGGQ